MNFGQLKIAVEGTHSVFSHKQFNDHLVCSWPPLLMKPITQNNSFHFIFLFRFHFFFFRPLFRLLHFKYFIYMTQLNVSYMKLIKYVSVCLNRKPFVRNGYRIFLPHRNQINYFQCPFLSYFHQFL